MIKIRENRLGRCVHAARVIEPGEVILTGWGPQVPERTRHSIEVDESVHIDFTGPIPLINHSCDPNCGMWMRPDLERAEVHALRRIEAGEELFTDYASFEREIVFMPAECLCGSAICRGRIVGYVGLPTERRAALGPYIAPHLRLREPAFAEAV